MIDNSRIALKFWLFQLSYARSGGIIDISNIFNKDEALHLLFYLLSMQDKLDADDCYIPGDGL